MRVLVTGADGFVGRNLVTALEERGDEVIAFLRDHGEDTLPGLLAGVDGIVHLAGTNRPADPLDFTKDNAELTEVLANAVRSASGPPIPIVFASSTQALNDNPYGLSKRSGEAALDALADVAHVAIFRLPNIFGKWARPFYNSAVATFCHCAARGLPLPVNDASAALTLVYVDDAVAAFLHKLDNPAQGPSWPTVSPAYRTSVGEVASIIKDIAAGREQLEVVATGCGLRRALYATYLSHLPHDRFSYPLVVRGDSRGQFIEVVKTPDSGQVSYFTQVRGLTRGGHYHHSKSEKFVVVKGHANFRFRHLVTGERVSVEASAANPTVVDTIPGWAHDVINMGEEELIVLVWANEVFDRDRPDTIVSKVDK